LSGRRGSAAPPTVSNPPFVHDLVSFAKHDDTWLPLFRLRLADNRKVHNGQQIAFFAEMRHRAVHDDFARTAFAGNRVSLKPFAIGHVAAEDFFIRAQADLFHQVNRNGEAALIFHVAARDRGAVYFRFQQNNLHELSSVTHPAITSTGENF
jgi:hypothetical protein